eukprot:3450113-Prymnesium_polylepis.1
MAGAPRREALRVTVDTTLSARVLSVDGIRSTHSGATRQGHDRCAGSGRTGAHRREARTTQNAGHGNGTDENGESKGESGDSDKR